MRLKSVLMKLYPVCILFLLLAAVPASAKAWRGIEPLHSTRADVERILGLPNFDKSPQRPIYDFPEERVHITYSSGVCEEGVPGGWNVPRDTVLEIHSYPGTWRKLSEVLTPGKEYDQIRAAHTSHIYYVDSEEGISFTVQEDVVQSIRYGPAAKDKSLACGEYKYAAPVPAGVKLSQVEHYAFDRFGNISFDDATARLDNFVIHLFELKKENPLWRGYIIVYAGRRSYIGEAQFKANCYKNFLVRVRKMDPASLFAVDGGFREEMEVELYIGRADYYPPVLWPTLSPKRVEAIRRRLKSCAEPGR